MPAPVLELDDVEVRRGSAYPLSGVNWRVDAGERWVVLGPNGSGKTTLLAVARSLLPDPALLLLDEPTAGLDLGGRERLVQLLTPGGPAVVGGHRAGHPPRRGDPPGLHPTWPCSGAGTSSQGPLDEILTAEALSDLHGLPLRLDRIGERWVVPHRERRAASRASWRVSATWRVRRASSQVDAPPGSPGARSSPARPPRQPAPSALHHPVSPPRPRPPPRAFRATR